MEIRPFHCEVGLEGETTFSLFLILFGFFQPLWLVPLRALTDCVTPAYAEHLLLC
jgi:hypothetical protein